MKKNYLIGIVVISMIVMGYLMITSKDSRHPTDDFRFRVTSEPPSLDWSLATDHVSKDFLFNIMDGLIQYDENLNVKPALAERWDVSRNGKRYTFHLRKDVVWTDGKALTAHDFVYGWQRLLNPKTGAEYAYFLFDVENAQEYNRGEITDFNKVGVHAADNDTLVVDLWHPASYFITIHQFWVTYPMRKDIIDKHGNRWTEPEHITTLGPFKLKSWEHDYRIILEANPRYWGPKPKVKTVTAYIVNEDSTALSLYETGKLDIIREIPPLVISKYLNHPDHQTAPYLRGYYYGFNVEKKPFDDIRVRKAFAMAIDRSQFPKILGGNQIPITSWVPKGMPGYEPTVGLEFNKSKAQKLLAEAGYPHGQGFPTFQLVYDSRDDNKVVAENLQNQLKDTLNVNPEIINQEWKIHLKQLTYDAPHFWRLGWGADFPDPDNFLNLFTSHSGNNHTRWKNSEYDKLIAAAASEYNLKKRLTIYKKAQQILTEKDVPIIPLFLESLNFLIKPYIEGYIMDAMATHNLRHVSVSH